MGDQCPECGVAVGKRHILGCSMSFAVVPKRDFWSTPAPTAQQEWEDDTIALSTEGRKNDIGKARHDLIPPELPDAVAQVLAFGANKYGERNWEKGMKWGRPYAALMRHMWAWWRGEKADPETGMSHLWHASCCLAFLVAFEARKTGVDDRPV